jgi:hypothetical protein
MPRLYECVDEERVTKVQHPSLPNQQFWLLPDLTLICNKTKKTLKKPRPFDDKWEKIPAKGDLFYFFSCIA